MPRDYLEKYLIIQKDFPNKAGKLASLLAVQKRIITKLATTAKDPEIIALISLIAESYDLTVDLLDWNKSVLQGVLNDAESLAEGAKIRNTIKMQSEIISEYLK